MSGACGCFTAHFLQASLLNKEELSVLNPLTKMRRLHLEAHPDDPRLDRLSLGHDVLVMTHGVVQVVDAGCPAWLLDI